jgi:hypothetical protein
VCDAASYNIGGRNNKNTTAGLSVIEGSEGIIPRHSRTVTSNTGPGNFHLSAIASSAIRIAHTNIMSSKFRITIQLKQARQLMDS